MSMKGDLSGLKKLADNARALGKTTQVKLLDLMNPGFISKHTQSPDFLSFCEAAGYKVETDEDFLAIPDEPWDLFIAENTPFADWADMQARAGEEYAHAILFKGIKH
ncbi:hypothetical protein [Pseudomonas syringae]|uniref:hypothetical protein n=1 Tax=Pseudomonas syringae TaxID=317 RepID=UPI000730BC20|nr:hypothetical protein [Pseudomonas syringae]KTC05576.1 hypothetical protein AO386_03140 [Pseudomonas syringae ICMP 11292]